MDFLLEAAKTASNTSSQAAGGGLMGTLGMLLPMVIMFAILYFFMIRPQKKKDKEIQDMRSGLQIGDEVITTGGIIGIVVSLKEDTLVIETGSDRSKVRIARWAVAQNNTVHDA